MAPKALFVLGVLMASLLFISSEVTARELAEGADGAAAVGHQGGGGCQHGCCGGYYQGHCRQCCHGGGGGGCQYGCCGGYYQGRCRKCCSHGGGHK